VRAVFSDIELIAKQCKFKNCQHQSEPGCAILKALEAGELQTRRLTNYQKMLKEQARNSMHHFLASLPYPNKNTHLIRGADPLIVGHAANVIIKDKHILGVYV
jgi:hypothetical protein